MSRAEVLQIAEAYRVHAWQPTAANILHGNDSKGIRVDTPDIAFKPKDNRPGWWKADEWNFGVPYQWGGFATLKQFDKEVRQGKAAGDIYTSAKRAGLDDAVSTSATGIDCSGFISRCWRLDRSVSTRELAQLCEPLPNYEALKPGDILNVHNAHVLLFAGWQDSKRTRLYAYETGSPPTWKVLRHHISSELLKSQGYTPLRYRGIRD